jgi:nucleotide-binding universal stress UspA family protein
MRLSGTPSVNTTVTLKKILVPVDFSDHSQFAAQQALSIAEVCRAQIDFLHVGDAAEDSAARLCEFVKALRPPAALTLKRFVARGAPENMILSTARKLTSDAIVMGHRDLSKLKHLMHGSVAEKVLREAICPVMVIKKQKSPEFNGYVLPQLRNITGAFQADKVLVPLDFSPASKQALRHAVHLAAHYNSTIYTLTVFDKKYKETGDDGKSHTAVIVHGRKIQLWKAFPELLRSAPGYDPDTTRIKRLLLDGDPFAKIESLVAKKAIDLVIMGTNGRTGLEHFLIGSVAEKVLRSIACPVMTIRGQRDTLHLR